MSPIIPDQIVPETGVESPQAYESKDSLDILEVNTDDLAKGIENPQSGHEEEQQFSGGCIKLNIKANITQIGKDNAIVYSRDKEPTRHDIESKAQGDSVRDEFTITDHYNTEKKAKHDHRKKRRGLKKEDDRRIVVPTNIQPSDPAMTYRTFIQLSDEVMMALHESRDNGQWGVFSDAVQRMSRKHTSIEAELIILLEKSQAVSYRNDLEKAENMILRAIRKADNTANSSSLIGRAYFYLSGVYRKMPKSREKANNCADIAKQILHNRERTLDTTFADYERGCVLMGERRAVSDQSPTYSALKEEAKTCFKKCIEVSVELEQDTTTERYIKKHHFAYIKIAMMILECRTAADRTKKLSPCDIQEAKHCLDTLRQHYWHEIANGEKVQYFLAMSDLSWRLKDLEKARLFAQMALEKATKFGFKTEIQPAMRRLQEMQVLIQEIQGTPLEPDTAVFSEEYYGDVSSACDSDDHSEVSEPLL